MHDTVHKLYRDTAAAEMLGCSRSTIWRWTCQGVIPRPIRIGGVMRWRHSDLMAVIDRALDQRKVGSTHWPEQFASRPPACCNPLQRTVDAADRAARVPPPVARPNPALRRAHQTPREVLASVTGKSATEKLFIKLSVLSARNDWRETHKTKEAVQRFLEDRYVKIWALSKSGVRLARADHYRMAAKNFTLQDAVQDRRLIF